MTRLPLIPIAAPCSEDWSAMAGDDRSRHCDRCQTAVVHLSALTADEARRTLDRPDRPACVRYLRAPDGAVITRTDQQQRLTALLRAMASRRPPGDPP